LKRPLEALADRLVPANSNRRMLCRALRDISVNPRSLSHRFNAQNFTNFLKYRQRPFDCPICGRHVTPLYDLPDIPLRVEHKIGILRETLQCRNCLASMRHRSLAVALLDDFNARCDQELSSIAELSRRGLQGLRILDSDNFSATSELLRNCSGYSRCSYIPGRPWGSCLAPGCYNEDLQRLTFANGTFDIVLTSDVMEHVRDCDAAHREIFRVLRSGGVYIFNVPFDANAEDDIQLVDTTTPNDVFLCKPQIHGDPLSSGALAYRVFGRSLISRLQALGFDTEFRLLQQPNRMIIDGDVFVARKR
jgi:methyltransferase family protein